MKGFTKLAVNEEPVHVNFFRFECDKCGNTLSLMRFKGDTPKKLECSCGNKSDV